MEEGVSPLGRSLSFLRFCSRPLWTLRRFGGSLAGFVFPPMCLGCGGEVQSGDIRICAGCWASLVRVDERDPAFQSSLQRTTGSGALAALCVPWYFEREGALQALVHMLKYRGMTALGVELGEELGRSLGMQESERLDGWIPVPLHKSKYRERGFNQSVFIGRGIEKVLHIPCIKKALMRIRYTRSQTTLNVSLRASNVEGAFAVPRDAVRLVEGKTVLLVDDVITTGATMNACGIALRDAGAARVIGCALAVAR
jgi:ComF family protein